MMTCDLCGERWEATFFEEREETFEERVPIPMWDYSGDDTEVVESTRIINVCGNCR